MSDHIRCTCQDHLYCKQHRCYKQERKLQRLCNTSCHTCQCCGEQKSTGLFFLLRLCSLVHSQCRTRQTKDHKDKLTGEIPACICAEMNGRRICQLGKENVLSAFDHFSCHFHGTAHSGLPERKIKYMMQSKRDQCTFDDSEDQGSQITGSCYQSAKRIDSVLNHRPRKKHTDAHQYIYNRADDRDKAAAAEKCQRTRQFNRIKPIVKCRYTKSYNNTSKDTHLQCLDSYRAGDGSLKNKICDTSIIQDLSAVDQHGIDCRIHGEISDHSRKSCNLFFFFRHTNGTAYCKDDWQIVKQCTSSFAKYGQEHI